MTKAEIRERTPEWDTWIDKVVRLRETIENIENKPTMHNMRWVTNTADYYRERLEELKTKQPKKYLD